ncbi:MAG TPA: DoxX family protein, partial [Gaiellaceae bacterium]
AGGMGPRGTADYMESKGLHPGLANVVVAGLAELVSGVLLVMGFLTPLAGVLMFAVITVALVVEHLPNGMWESNGGVEYPLLLLGSLFALVCTGPGAWSVAHAAGVEPSGWRWGVVTFALGLAGSAAAIALGRLAARRGRSAGSTSVV